MGLKGDAFVTIPGGVKVVNYELEDVGRTRGKLYIMTLEPFGTSKYNVDRFKEEVIDVSDKTLESVIQDFISKAYNMGMRRFYIETGDGDLYEVTIKD